MGKTFFEIHVNLDIWDSNFTKLSLWHSSPAMLSASNPYLGCYLLLFIHCPGILKYFWFQGIQQLSDLLCCWLCLSADYLTHKNDPSSLNHLNMKSILDNKSPELWIQYFYCWIQSVVHINRYWNLLRTTHEGNLLKARERVQIKVEFKTDVFFGTRFNIDWLVTTQQSLCFVNCPSNICLRLCPGRGYVRHWSYLQHQYRSSTFERRKFKRKRLINMRVPKVWEGDAVEYCTQ